MIGVMLSCRRAEFMKFACENIIEYEEIIDIDIVDTDKYEVLFVDSLSDERIGQHHDFKLLSQNLGECLTKYVLDSSKSIVKDRASLAFAFLYFEELTKVFPTYFAPNTFDELFAEADRVSSITPNITKHTELGVTTSLMQETSDDRLPDSNFLNDIDNFNAEPERTQHSGLPFEAVPGTTNMARQNMGFSMPNSPMQSTMFNKAETNGYIAPIFQQQAISQNTNLQSLPPQYTQQFQQPGYTQPVQPIMPQQRVNKFATSTNCRIPTGAVIRAKGLASKRKTFQIPTYVFSSLTPKAGVTSIMYLLASILAGQQNNSRILYLDLNLSNPNYMLNMLNLNPGTDASVCSLLSITESEFMQNMSFLTETVMIDQTIFSLITLGQVQLSQRMTLASLNYLQMLETLSNSFDVILVDIGQMQATLPYQLTLLSSASIKNIIVADGSDNRLVRSFISLAQQLTYNFEIVINKNMAQSGAFTVMQQLRQQPLATVNFHRNINRYLTGQMLFQDSALYNELSVLGGKL